MLERKYRIPEQWWAAQPRVTTKSGWTCVQPGVLQRRVQYVMAIGELGIAVVQQVPEADGVHLGEFGGGIEGVVGGAVQQLRAGRIDGLDLWDLLDPGLC